MRLNKKIIAGVMSAALIFTMLPAVSIKSSAKTSYNGTYTKEIFIEEPEYTTKKVKVEPDPFDDTTLDDTSGVSSNTASSTPKVTYKTVKVQIAQKETVRVMPGMKFVLAATRYGKEVSISKNKSQFTYKTSNKKVAKVTNAGVVKTLKAGKCDITITNKKDKVQYILKLVVNKSVKVKSIKLNKKSKIYSKYKKGTKFRLEATVSPDKYSDIPVLWSSNKTHVATVDERGIVTIRGEGDVLITATAGSNQKSASCYIKVGEVHHQDEGGGGGGNKGGGGSGGTGIVVDISSHNTVVNWEKLRDNCDAVIIRVGYRGYGSGALCEDTSFRNNVYKCQQYGIPYSFYFFTTAVNESEGRQEGDWIANVISGLGTCMPVFIDTEACNATHTGRSDGLSVGDRTAAVRAACQQLSNRGFSAGVYGSTNWLEYKLNMSDINYPLWVAQYGPNCTYSGDKLLWQYTSTGTGYGVNTGGRDRCDLSYWYR